MFSKNNILSCVALVCISSGIYAQDATNENSPKVLIGGRLGLNLSSVAYGGSSTFTNEMKDDLTSNSATNLVLGIPLQIKLSQYVDFQTGLEFVKKGTKATFSNYFLTSKKASASYLEIPLLFRGGYNTNKFGVGVVFGPSLGFLVGGKLEKEYTNDREVSSLSDFIKSDEETLSRLDLGINIGAYAEYKLLNQAKLVFDIRYQRSLNKIYEYTYSPTGYNEYYRNRGVQISISYLHPLKVKS